MLFFCYNYLTINNKNKMENPTYPLSVSCYYLNYSYPGQLNFESRIFLTFPYPGQTVNQKDDVKFISICFEVNSAFKEEDILNPENSMGIKLMVNTINSNISKPINEKNILKAIGDDDANRKVLYNFHSESEMYEKMTSALKDFALTAYNQDWDIFCKREFEEYNKKIASDYTVKDYSQHRLDKVISFVLESCRRLDVILKEDINLDEKIKNLNISFYNISLFNKKKSFEELGLLNMHKLYASYQLEKTLSKKINDENPRRTQKI